MKTKADRYWDQYVASQVDEPARYVEAFTFGFTVEDASEIGALVRKGAKTATGSVYWSYEADGKPIPKVGDHWVVNDGNGDPICIIQTVEVAIIPFDEVPESYARDGGEGDRTLATWRPMYWRYITEECQRIGREPSAKAPLLLERFQVVHPRVGS